MRDWQRSGQTAREFGATQGVQSARLPWWRWRLGLGDAMPPELELVKVDVVPEAVSGAAWELRTAGGDVLRVEAPIDPASLREILAALGVGRAR